MSENNNKRDDNRGKNSEYPPCSPFRHCGVEFRVGVII